MISLGHYCLVEMGFDMKIIFMRHDRLQKPYHNYDNLSFDELSELAKGKIEPGVDKLWFKEHINNFLSTNLINKLPSNIKLLYSPSRRARETAILLSKKLNIKNKDLMKINELHEIIFDPHQLISERVYKQRGMQAIREAVFTSWIKGDLIESLESCFARIESLEKKFREIKSDIIFNITHGFFLRLLYLYFVERIKEVDKVSLESIKNAPNFNYASGFSFGL